MNKRVITGTIIGFLYSSVVLLSTYVHPIFFDVFIALLAACGVYEVAKALGNKFSKPIFVLDIICVALGFGGFWFAQYYFQTNSAGITAFFIVLLFMIAVTAIVVACSKTYVKGNAISTIFAMIYPCSFFMFSVGLNYLMTSYTVELGSWKIAGATPYRNAGICLMFVVPAFTDTFAMITGMIFKGRKLCPTISPNKTVSGAIGGLFGGMFGASIVLLCTFLGEHFGVNLFGLGMLTDSWATTVVNLLLLGLFGAVFDQIGDLVASYIKRKCGIKDYSNLLPGHGGVLDRVDGFMFCGVLYYMYLSIMFLI